MKKTIKHLTAIAVCMAMPLEIMAQTAEQRQQLISQCNLENLVTLQEEFSERYSREKQEALELATQNGWDIKKTLSDGTFIELQKISSDGTPLYYATYNVDAAESTRTNFLHSGGGLGLNLNGEAMTAYVWDAGVARETHQEYDGFGGNDRFSIGDGSTTLSNHAAHVTGTIIASGVMPRAKGMAPAASAIGSNWNSDGGEVATAAAAAMLISNHSYGFRTSNLPDRYFGGYTTESRDWDKIMFNAPHYLLVGAAGNDGTRDNINGTPLDGNSAYDKLGGTFQTAKNTLIVANAQDALINANGSLNSVVISSGSSEGPTDDLRIKPDITGNGTSVFSTYKSNDTAYDTISGTSMATPNVTGSLLLLQQYHAELNGFFMRAATLKGLALHTADDMNINGPDAISGWGLLNARAAAEVLCNAGDTAVIDEVTLNTGNSYTISVDSDGVNPLVASISWTDRPGTPATTVNSPTPVLVNDLDIRITQNGITYEPYRLTAVDANGTGDNNVDPYERIDIPNASGTYTITVTHKGALVGGTQEFSIIVTGIDTGIRDCDPVAHYSFNSNINPGIDQSPYENHGVVYDADIVEGFMSNAVQMNPTDNSDEFLVPDDPSLDITCEMTGIAWIRPLGTHTSDSMPPNCIEGTIFTKGGNYWFQVGQNNDALMLQNTRSGADFVRITTLIPTFSWTQVAFVRCADNYVTFYKNGMAIGSGSLSETPTANDNELSIGDFGPSSRGSCEFNGLIDEIKIFPYALNSDEILTEYNKVVSQKSREQVLLAGNKDSYDSNNPSQGEPTSPSQALINRFGVDRLKDFDSVSSDKFVAHTFGDLSDASGAQLEIKLKPSDSSQSDNDTIALEFNGSPFIYFPSPPRWGSRIADANPNDPDVTGLLDKPWEDINYPEPNDPDGVTITLDLSALPQADGCSTYNIVPFIRDNGFLDVLVQDNTIVDYFELTINPFEKECFHAGINDNFNSANPSNKGEPAVPSTALANRVGNRKDFDSTSIDKFVAHTFCDFSNVGGAALTIKLRPEASGADNDAINLEFNTDSGMKPQRWSRRIGRDDSRNVTGLQGILWNTTNYPNGDEITLDLSALPQEDGSTYNMVPSIGLNGFLDVFVQDDTTVDYCKLTIYPYNRAPGSGWRWLVGGLGGDVVLSPWGGLILDPSFPGGNGVGNVGAMISFPDNNINVGVDTQSTIGFEVPSLPVAAGAPTTWSASFNSNDITDPDNNIISTFTFNSDGAGNLSVQPVFSGFRPSTTFVATVKENGVVVSQNNWLGLEAAPLISLDGNLTTPDDIMIQSESTTTITSCTTIITTEYDWTLETSLGDIINLLVIVTDSTGQPVVETVEQSIVTFSAEGASLSTSINMENIQATSGPVGPVGPVVPVFPIWAYPILVSALIGLGIRKKIIK